MALARRRIGSRAAVAAAEGHHRCRHRGAAGPLAHRIFGGGKLVNGYLQSKRAAERLIRHARARGIAVDVHRPGSPTTNRPASLQVDFRRSATRQ
uniref:SDR family oxidoreductase n=1 Tax=Streptomyces sp. TG1A-60 TaxID=3129111 RepID=UPI00403FCF5F